MTEIKLTKRYPHSRTEDITDAFMRGYEQGKKDGLKVGKQIVLGAFETYITADRKTEPQTDLLVTEYPQDGEVNLIGRDKTEAVVMAYDVYKELTEPQTDCSWK